MPREHRALASEVVAAPKVVIASAARLTGASTRKPNAKMKPISTEEWQRRAWEWFDEIPEYRYAVVWMGSMLSKATLYATYDGAPTDNPEAVRLMQLLFGGEQGQGEMLRQLGIQFAVAGEAYLVGEDGGDQVTDEWHVVAATEMTNAGGVWKAGKRELRNPLIIRMWRPHPREFSKSDSPSRPVLPILAELDGLTKHIAAQIDSRLAGAGLLLFPEEITLGSTVRTTVNENNETVTQQQTGIDVILQELLKAMMTPIANREDASALVPVIGSGPGEHLDKVRHITFANTLDGTAKELREEAIRRLALGMDLPPEVLTGTGDVNHWGAWQIDETSVKAHAEPALAVICNSLTIGYLRPLLKDAGLDDEEVMRYGIGADTAKLRLRPNRSKEAIELYNLGELSPVALLRENGFDPEDAMTDDQRAMWATKRLAGGTPSPEAVVEALRMLGVNLDPSVIRVEEAPTPERPTPSLEDLPRQDPPEEPDVAAAEVLVFRALERAGNRLKNARRSEVAAAVASGVSACDLYMHTKITTADARGLLQDAWAHCERFCSVPSEQLNMYAMGLLVTGSPHSRKLMKKFLINPRLTTMDL